MPLTRAQIRPGTVAYLSTNALRDHEDIEPSKPVFPKADKSICHVCYAVLAETSYWSPLTRIPPKPPFERLEVIRAWRLRGDMHDHWNADPVYLRDGAMTYRGPMQAFVVAASRERYMDPRERPLVSKAGLAAIMEEIVTRGGFMPKKTQTASAAAKP